MSAWEFGRGTFVVLALALLVGVSRANEAQNSRDGESRHIVVVVIPLYGHFMPLKAVAEQLYLKGHRVTLIVEDAGWCASTIAKFQCEVAPSTKVFTPQLFENCSLATNFGDSMTMLFGAMMEHHTVTLGTYISTFRSIEEAHGKIDLLFVDLSTYVGFALAAKFNVPYVSMFPLTLQMTVGPETWVPSLGTAFPQDMSFSQRWFNWLLRTLLPAMHGWFLEPLNRVRREHGIAPLNSLTELAGLHSLMLAPTIWGYDIPQPVCPNIVPLGVITPSHEHAPLEKIVEAFLQSEQCNHGALYVNFGTLAKVSDAIFEKLFVALSLVEQCVVWKVTEERHQKALQQRLPGGAGSRFYIAKRFANPVAIMEHVRTVAFLSHCGDTSVGEAISSDLPIVGIPFFADQGDVCRRVEESGIGLYVGDKLAFTAESLTLGLQRVAENRSGVSKGLQEVQANSFLRAVKKIHAISDYAGGAPAGAEVIDRWLRLGMLSAPWSNEPPVPLMCSHVKASHLWELQGYDTLAIALLFWLGVYWLVWRMLCR